MAAPVICGFFALAIFILAQNLMAWEFWNFHGTAVSCNIVNKQSYKHRQQKQCNRERGRGREKGKGRDPGKLFYARLGTFVVLVCRWDLVVSAFGRAAAAVQRLLRQREEKLTFIDMVINTTRNALGRAHLPPTTVFRRLKTTRRCFDGRPIRIFPA